MAYLRLPRTGDTGVDLLMTPGTTVAQVDAEGTYERLAVERRRAPLVGIEPDHASHRRALARPVRSEEPGHPPRSNVEAEVVDGNCLPESFRQVADFDHQGLQSFMSRSVARPCD